MMGEKKRAGSLLRSANGNVVNKPKVGFDIDGVLSKKEIARSPEECIGVERSSVPVPSDECEIYIVSSRTKDMEENTRAWLAENGIEYEKLVLLEEGGFEGLSKKEINQKQAAFKAATVREYDLDIYVEDQANVREYLREHCPGCIVLSPSEARRAWRFVA
ncbi:hypothetical protein AKJ65_02145 [candidate division MSBL1 archaeon SCGC-AAA259E19]|uniref:Uncharacterized protein n=1 Tax=candidate division MSBL1 archaeon SCGC-AAA259E19 TaxID=1698264 RepID=A0A133UM62_9EURY|nr:hypothetical protein AKJ65_02145 [candidate division MSBL1 archaeon SCGC-AAA259E19]